MKASERVVLPLGGAATPFDRTWFLTATSPFLIDTLNLFFERCGIMV